MSLGADEISSSFKAISSWDKPMYIGSSEDRVEIANLYAKEVGVHEFFTDNKNVDSDGVDASKIFDIKSSFTPDSKSKLFLGVDKFPVELLQERVKIAKAQGYTLN